MSDAVMDFELADQISDQIIRMVKDSSIGIQYMPDQLKLPFMMIPIGIVITDEAICTIEEADKLVSSEWITAAADSLYRHLGVLIAKGLASISEKQE